MPTSGVGGWGAEVTQGCNGRGGAEVLGVGGPLRCSPITLMKGVGNLEGSRKCFLRGWKGSGGQRKAFPGPPESALHPLPSIHQRVLSTTPPGTCEQKDCNVLGWKTKVSQRLGNLKPSQGQGQAERAESKQEACVRRRPAMEEEEEERNAEQPTEGYLEVHRT